MTIHRNIPSWCVREVNEIEDKYHKDRCCFCGKREKFLQIGDGRFLHTLCFNHKFLENKKKKEMK